MAYLTRTPNQSATNTKKATFSWWTKIAGIEKNERAVWFGNQSSNDGNNHRVLILKQDNSQQSSEDNRGSIQVQFQDASGTAVDSSGCSVLAKYPITDETAWYHFVVAIDTTLGTAADRVKIWVNGIQVTDLHGTVRYYPDQNLDFYYFNNQSGGSGPKSYVNLGKDSSNGNMGGGQMLMSEVHAIDGTAYDVSTFGQFSTQTGAWSPKSVSGVSYGNGGFHLKFEDASNLGLDSSGNSNNLTTSGTIKKVVDNPSNNFATLDGTTLNLQSWGQDIINSGNGAQSSSTTNWETTPINHVLSKGKWYFEAKIDGATSLCFLGLCDYVEYSRNNYDTSRYLGDNQSSRAYAYYTSSSGQGRVWTGGGSAGYTTSGIAAFGDGDIIMAAFDFDNNKIYFGKNGTWNNSGDPTSGATGTGAHSIEQNTASTNYHGKVLYSPALCVRAHASGTGKVHLNFGSGFFGSTAVSSATNDASGFGTFEYTVPSGYYAICTKNIDLYG